MRVIRFEEPCACSSRMASVAFCVQVAEIEAILVAKLDARQEPLIIDVFTIHDTISPHPACRPPSPARGRGAGGEGVPPIGVVVTYLEIPNIF